MCRTCNGVLPSDTDDPDRVCKCGDWDSAVDVEKPGEVVAA